MSNYRELANRAEAVADQLQTETVIGPDGAPRDRFAAEMYHRGRASAFNEMADEKETS